MPPADDPPARPRTATVAATGRRAPAVDRLDLAALGVLVACAGILAWNLGRAAYLFDEQLYARIGWEYVHRGSAARGDIGAGNFEHPPLAKLLFGVAQLVAQAPASVTAARAVAVAASLGGAVALWLVVRAAAGRAWGLLTASAYLLLPTAASPQVTTVARAGLLDCVSACFVAWSLWFALRWLQASGRAAWWAAVGLGLMTGAATAAKENGFLAAPGLVIAVVLLRRRHRPGQVGADLARGAAAAVACGLTFVATYLPFDRPAERIWYLVAYQSEHSAGGHPVGLAGQVYRHPPWWANLWFAGQALGPLLVVVVAVGLASALLSRSPVVGLLAAGLAGPLVFHCLVAGVALNFYWWTWWSLALALAALGLARVPALSRVAGAALVLLCAVGAWRCVTLPVEGANAVVAARAAHHLRGEVLTVGVYPTEVVPADRSLVIRTRVGRLDRVDTVVVGAPRCRTVPDRAAAATVAAALASGSLRELHRDRLFTTYQVVRPLREPTRAEIDAVPRRAPADGC